VPRLVRVALVLGALAVVGACSSGFVYNRLDRIVSWYVNGLVSLEDAQERQLRVAVSRTLDWHRATQLPAYIRVLEEMAEEAGAPLSAARLEQRYQQVSVWIDAFLRHANPDVAALLRTFSAEQVSELAESLAEDTEDLEEDYAGRTAEIRHEQRVRGAIRALQRFTGRLSAEQRELVARRLAGMHDVSGEWLERRRHWQERFLLLLRADSRDAAGFEAALLDLVLHPDQFDTPGYRRRVEENRGIVVTMVAELSTTFTPRQHERSAQKFRDLAGDLQEIAESDCCAR
jgi:hypothetical protein